MGMLGISVVILVVICLAGFYGWQANKDNHNGLVPEIEPAPPEGVPALPPNLPYFERDGGVEEG